MRGRGGRGRFHHRKRSATGISSEDENGSSVAREAAEEIVQENKHYPMAENVMSVLGGVVLLAVKGENDVRRLLLCLWLDEVAASQASKVTDHCSDSKYALF